MAPVNHSPARNKKTTTALAMHALLNVDLVLDELPMLICSLP